MMFDGFLDDLKRMNIRQFLYQLLIYAMIFSTTSMVWMGLIIFTHCDSPIVVVLSSSMEPALHQGDLLLITNYEEEPLRVGEIVLFKVKAFDIPVMHRVLRLHEKSNGTIKFLTKGDNNNIDDRGLYGPGLKWLEKSDMIGKAKGYLPYVGTLKILMKKYSIVKNAILAYLSLYLIVHRV